MNQEAKKQLQKLAEAYASKVRIIESDRPVLESLQNDTRLISLNFLLHQPSIASEPVCQAACRVYPASVRARVTSKVNRRVLMVGEELSTAVVKVSKEENISVRTLRRWYQTQSLSASPSLGGKKPMFPELEELLKRFIERNPQATRKLIKEQAKVILNRLRQEYPTEAEKMDSFRFSHGWYQKFRVRKGIKHLINGASLESSNQKFPEDYRTTLADQSFQNRMDNI